MAQLVMTIDSDSEIDEAIKGNSSKKKKTGEQQEEEILLGHQVILQDHDNKHKQKKFKGGSGNLWNFAESVQVDNTLKNQLADEFECDETTAPEDKAPFKLTIEERVDQKFKQHSIVLPTEITSFHVDKDKNTGDDKEEVQSSIKNTKLMHYDKEDLISFHQLFISKPLTKAASDLDYEHPTVIQR